MLPWTMNAVCFLKVKFLASSRSNFQHILNVLCSVPVEEPSAFWQSELVSMTSQQVQDSNTSAKSFHQVESMCHLLRDIQVQTGSFLLSCDVDRRSRDEEMLICSDSSPLCRNQLVRLVLLSFSFVLSLSAIKKKRITQSVLRDIVVAKLRQDGRKTFRGGFIFKNLEGNSLEKSFVEPGDVIFVSMPVRLNVNGQPFMVWPHDSISILVKRVAAFFAEVCDSPGIVLVFNGIALDPSLRIMNYGIVENTSLEAHVCQ